MTKTAQSIHNRLRHARGGCREIAHRGNKHCAAQPAEHAVRPRAVVAGYKGYVSWTPGRASGVLVGVVPVIDPSVSTVQLARIAVSWRKGDTEYLPAREG